MRCCSVLLFLAALGVRRSAPFSKDAPNQNQGLIFGDNKNLEWLDFKGSAPNGAVSIRNGYTGRTDYVCKAGCEAGFYRPNLGPYCHYPYGGREIKAGRFQLLVNKDNFEFLDWQEGSYGSVPQNAVRTCVEYPSYVGKNMYGLGKVVPRFEAFFLPLEGSEYWYKTYQVLAINSDMYSQSITDVKYGVDEAKTLNFPPETMRVSDAVNHACQPISKTVALSKRSDRETSWNIGRGFMLGVSTTISAQVPFIGGVDVSLSAQTNLQFDKGTSHTESISHTVTVSVSVPPNHSCRVRMEGKKFKLDVPFTARLSRTYSNGKTAWTSITGTYNGVGMGEIRAVVERCKPLANAQPCP